jgi:hypothetical protein
MQVMRAHPELVYVRLPCYYRTRLAQLPYNGRIVGTLKRFLSASDSGQYI